MKTTMAVNNFCKMLHCRCSARFWIFLGFWFWIYQGSEYAWICQINFRISLNMPVRPKYTWMPKSAWMGLVLFPHCNPLSNRTRGYLFQCLFETTSYGLKNYKDVSLKRQNLIFSIATGSIWFVFCFKLNIFPRFQITLFNQKLSYRVASHVWCKNSLTFPWFPWLKFKFSLSFRPVNFKHMKNENMMNFCNTHVL